MKYFTYEYNYDLFPNGEPIIGSDGDMLNELEQEKLDKFHNHFSQWVIPGEPPEAPSFNFIKCKSNNKVGKLDYLGDFYSFGMILSHKFKEVLETSRLGKHYFYNVVLKHDKRFDYDYYFFCLGERSYNAIDFTKSYFYIPDPGNSRYRYYRENYVSSLFKFKDCDDLIQSFGKYKYHPAAYNIVIKKERILDLLDLNFLTLGPSLNFSEELVNKIIELNLAPNLEFHPIDYIEY